MSRDREKGILVEADPEPERTLKRKLREAKLQQSRNNLSEIFKQEKDMAAKNNNNNAGECLVTSQSQHPSLMEEASPFLPLEPITLSLSLN